MKTFFETVNPDAAGIDIGSEKIFVSTDGTSVASYGTFTADYLRCAQELVDGGIKRVAMEATGVYWLALHEILEDRGIEVCLVNPKSTSQVKGRKTDVRDCQWIQKLFSAGLLRQSYIPAGKLKELRMLVRERGDIIEMGSAYVNKMQKALELMNIKLKNVISQIHGASGIRMVEAILAGERDPGKLLSLCHEKIRSAKADQVLMALEGNYNDTWLFLLGKNMEMWKAHQEHLLGIDLRIEGLLKEITAPLPHVAARTKAKPIRHHRPAVADLHQRMLDMYGTSIDAIAGLTDYSALKLAGETGTDMSRFPTVKHFISWCQLSPNSNKSGKMNRRARVKHKSRAGQIFREAARTLLNSKNSAIGVFMRKIRSKKGGLVAIKAGARKIAVAYYNTITKGEAYVEQGAINYEARTREREVRFLKHLAAKHNLQLADIQHD